jgi:hypothetical protein
MSEFSITGNFLVDLLIGIAIPGTAAAAGITTLANWLMKNREEYIELSKYI